MLLTWPRATKIQGSDILSTTITGSEGNDTLVGGNGQDTIDGGTGNDSVSGGNGNDILDGGAGSDRVFGNNGDDIATYVTIDNIGATDVYDGGNGFDTLVIKLTQAQLDEMNASTVFSDFRAAAGTHASLDFSVYGFSFGINLTAINFERIQTVVIADPNPPPVAHADANAIDEDALSNAVAGNVLANDTDQGPAQPGLSIVHPGAWSGHYGTLTLNADGSYSYVLNQTNAAVDALNDGDALQDIFTYVVTDGVHQDAADLTITIRGHTDPALFTAGDDFVDFNAVVAGTYQDATQYDALAGDDTVILPADATAAAEAGYVVGTAFHAGDGRNHIVGGALDDIIIGGNDVDTIDGGEGHDTILGGGGDDMLTGGAGDDRIEGGLGNDIVRGGAGDDILDGGAGINRLMYDDAASAVGVDLAAGVAVGFGGLDTTLNFVDSVRNFQEVVGGNFRDELTGDDNDNSLFGLGSADHLAGGGGNDHLEGADGDDLLFGDDGDDHLFGGYGSNIVDGGNGSDTADYSDIVGGVDVNISGSARHRLNPMDLDQLISIENVVGSQGDDFIVGDHGANRITGGLGNDTLMGFVGGDVFHFDLSGGVNLGNDIILDFQIGLDRISVVGGPHDGLTDLNPQQVGQDTVLDLGFGTTVTLLNTQASVLITSLSREFGGDHLEGGNGIDHLEGGDGDDVLFGYGGEDLLSGNGGDDLLFGNDGSDDLFGGYGSNVLDGGNGSDTANYSDIVGGIDVNLLSGSALQRMNPMDRDQLISIENVVGSQGDDIIVGDQGGNEITGGLGDDRLEGGGGTDFLAGGDGDDLLFGNGDNDLLVGNDGDDDLFAGYGNNFLDGGNGSDTANYSDTLGGIDVNLLSGSALQRMNPTERDQLTSIENVVGSQGDDFIVGDQGANRITGGLGDDTMVGLAGGDVFLFDLSGGVNLGNDIIFDFQIGIDRISVAGGSHNRLADLNPHQVGQDTVLDLGFGTTVTLLHTQASLLTNNDFVF